jgi:hypothetical protein
MVIKNNLKSSSSCTSSSSSSAPSDIRKRSASAYAEGEERQVSSTLDGEPSTPPPKRRSIGDYASTTPSSEMSSPSGNYKSEKCCITVHPLIIEPDDNLETQLFNIAVEGSFHM